jgi:hypothetical protein
MFQDPRELFGISAWADQPPDPDALWQEPPKSIPASSSSDSLREALHCGLGSLLDLVALDSSTPEGSVGC